MNGVSYIIDETSQIKALVIDVKLFEKYDGPPGDLVEAIIAEYRNDSPSIRWDDLKKHLRKKGKL
jgi:hypothetical protein